MNITFKASPNYNERDGAISYLILHYTGTSNAQEAQDVYLDKCRDPKAGPVSPHYMIDKNGDITQFVEESKRAWHAGKSFWSGVEDMNSRSVGIELVNEGEFAGYPDFAEKQISSLIKLGHQICARHNITPASVLGHSDIAPGRKLDPGPSFPWKHLAEQGLGIWPSPSEQEIKKLQNRYQGKDAQKILIRALVKIGYNPDCDPQILAAAFRAHYGSGVKDDVELLARAHFLEKVISGQDWS